MTTVHQTPVPIPTHPNTEICHAFVFRWLVASGRFTGNVPDPSAAQNGLVAEPMMWAPRGAPARVNGFVVVMPFMIIGFWDGPFLAHSMIALTSTRWIGANNLGCFGTASTARVIIPNVDDRNAPYANVPPNRRPGWAGQGNVWRRPDGATLTVTCKAPPLRVFH